MKRRFLCVLVALCVVFVLLPVSAKAESPQAQWGVAAADGTKPAEWAGSGTLEAALTYANTLSGGAAYIQLLSDVTAAKTVTFAQGTTILDLNGCTLGAAGSSGVIALSGGTLTIDDNSDGGNGKVTSAAGAKDIGTINVSGGSLVVDGGTVENLYNSTNVHTISVSSGNVTVNGGKVVRTSDYSFAYAINNIGGGTISVNGGIVTGGSYAIYNNSSGTVNVTGGEVSANKSTVIFNKGTVHMTGGTVENTNTFQSTTIYNYDSGRVSIDGGEVRGSNPIFMPEYSTSTVNVTGGKVIASLDYAIESQGKGSISVTGGELIGRSCAIRCSEYSTANVSVTGGELTSTGFWTIFNFGSGNLSVADARVESKTSMYGAIYQRSTGKLTIGGTAVVTSPYQSSTSGTIYMQSGSTLEINGGMVENTNTGTDGLAISVKDNNGRVSIKSSSPVIIKAPGKAMTIAPDLPDTVVKTAATDINGIDGVETYNPDHIATYKYLEFVPAVAKIGSTGYPTMQAAIDAVTQGDTITLERNVQENITITGSASFTMNLNGKTLDGGTCNAITHNGSGKLTITDSSIGGMVTGSTGISGIGTGEIVVLGGTIKGTNGSAITCAQLTIDPAGTVVVKSGAQAMSVSPALPEDSTSYQWRTSDEGEFAAGPYGWDSSHTYVEIRPAYAVTYHPGVNGTGSQATDSKTHDADLTLRGALFTREGYTQTGWATTDGGAKAFDLGSRYTTNAAITLYPVWTPNTYAVTLPTGTGYTVMAQDGSSSPVTHGGSYSFTVTIADGYDAGDSFAVKTNGAPLTADGSGVYTIANITQAQTVTVEGVEREVPAPSPTTSAPTLTPTPTPEPTPTPTPEPTPTPTPEPTPTPTPEPTPTPTPESTPTPTPEPTPTPTSEPTPTPTPEPTPTPTPEPTPTPTPELTPTPTPESTPTPTPESTPTQTPKPKPTPTPTSTPTPTPELTPSPTPILTPAPTSTPAADTVYNDPSVSDATIWLTGSGFDSDDLLVTQALRSGSDYRAMLKLAEGKDFLQVYEISLQSGTKSTGSAMYLTFQLEDQYAGQAFTLVHKKADGTYEYLYAKVGADGTVKFGPLYELSPFMLVKGTLNGDLDDVPKTGDSSAPWIWWLLCGVSAAGAALLIGMDKQKGRIKKHKAK